jgi:hypothetical protein
VHSRQPFLVSAFTVVELLFATIDLESSSDDGSKGFGIAFNGPGLQVCFGFYLFDKLPNGDVAFFLSQLRPVARNGGVPALSLKNQKDVSGLGGSDIPIRGSQAPFVTTPTVLDVNRQIRGFVLVAGARVDGPKNPISPVAEIGL